jgi:hypothetical protein
VVGTDNAIPQAAKSASITPKVKAWLVKHPRVHLHYTLTSCSWLNLVECFFSIITRQAIRRGAFTSVADLTAAIEAYISVK